MKTHTIPTELEALCETHNITITAVESPSRPGAEDWDTNPGASHWWVTLGRDALKIQAWYSQGAAFRRKPIRARGQRFGYAIKPKAADVLYCLLSDASFGQMPFADYCDELGLEQDSRRALATWEQCVKTNGEIRDFLGTLRETFENAEH
jgi:hypothetical protein